MRHGLTLVALLQSLSAASAFFLSPASRRTAVPPRSRVPSAAANVWYDGGGGASARRPLISGNWKLNPATVGQAKTLLRLLAANRRAQEASGASAAVPDVAVFPPHAFLATAVELLQGTSIAVGAQNIGERAEPGAFTGEVAASQVASLGCSVVLLGHSERRALFDETDEVIGSKVR